MDIGKASALASSAQEATQKAVQQGWWDAVTGWLNPSWVQAGTALVAVGVAIYIPWKTARNDRARERQALIARYNSALTVLTYELEAIKIAIYRSSIAKDDYNTIYNSLSVFVGQNGIKPDDFRSAIIAIGDFRSELFEMIRQGVLPSSQAKEASRLDKLLSAFSDVHFFDLTEFKNAISGKELIYLDAMVDGAIYYCRNIYPFDAPSKVEMNAQSIYEKLKEDFPKRHGLNPKEVAQVLGRNENSRGVLQKIREKMKDGTYPNAQKIDGNWQLPLEEMANLLAGNRSKQVPVSINRRDVTQPLPGKTISRRRATIGPKIKFIINARFWLQVHNRLGANVDRLWLTSSIQDVERELKKRY